MLGNGNDKEKGVECEAGEARGQGVCAKVSLT